MIKFIDMFSGIGGFREGLTRAGGFTCVGHCEIDKYANRSYNALFDTKGEWFVEDARKADPETMPDFRLLCGGFPSTLHAGEVKANIILAMAISAQAINQKYTQFKKTPLGDNPAFTFRTFLLRLGLIGPEYKNVRMHLLKNLPGDKAWRHDKSLYPSNQPRLHTDEVR